MIAMSSERKCPIIEAATHAKAIALIVKCDQGYEYDIERPGHDDSLRAYHGLWYAEAVFAQAGLMVERCEPQTFAGSRLERG